MIRTDTERATGVEISMSRSATTWHDFRFSYVSLTRCNTAAADNAPSAPKTEPHNTKYDESRTTPAILFIFPLPMRS